MKKKKTKKILSIDKKYCSCLMKVRSKNIKNPYGICTSSIFNKQGLTKKKIIKCSKHYDFSKYLLKNLRLYAKEKKIKNYYKLTKKKLIKKLNNLP